MKNSEIAALSVEDLKAKATELSANLEKMVLNHAITPLENPLTLRHTRREIARVKTELNKKIKSSK
ncbi:MAG TPA: 50S ribosomal protein L29 [Flavobacteriales bacterium]|nr:50S ribosomal protein L29 [Flavobacteriales bacterium]